MKMQPQSHRLDPIKKYFSEFSEVQLRQFAALDALYRGWNEKINVISRKDVDGLYLKHVLHSLCIAAVFSFKPGMKVIDIGAGGGFPSIPLAIFFPEVSFFAVDSIQKKLTVVKEIAQAAGIENICTRHSRAEEIRDMQFEVAVSRAVAPLKDLLYWSRAIVKPASQVRKQWNDADASDNLACGLICLKGGDLAAEVQESGRNPRVWRISEFFEEEYFREKYILQVK
jgi:16S rRNA (guanine527-N7)-methyltransferase